MTTYGVSLLSGGLDSTIVTTYANNSCDHLTALTFMYGQSHSKETQCAQQVAKLLGIQHTLVDISFLSDVAWYSAITNTKAFNIPKQRPTTKIGTSIPITYVPLRNTTFLSIAAAFLESRVLQAIEVDGVNTKNLQAHLYIASNAIDYSGYPDCRPEYYKKIEDTLCYGSKIGTEYLVPIEIETPIIAMSKSEIVQMGIRLNAPIEHTWSCYEGKKFPCSTCDSCILRSEGFTKADVTDPLLERLAKE